MNLQLNQKYQQHEIVKAIACRQFDVNETLSQLRHFGGIEFWSWGANKFVNCAHKALQFRVTGLKHKGNVFIALNAADLYDVVLTTSHGTVKCIMTDIYFDELFNLMHKKIEVSI